MPLVARPHHDAKVQRQRRGSHREIIAWDEATPFAELGEQIGPPLRDGLAKLDDGDAGHKGGDPGAPFHGTRGIVREVSAG